MGKWEFTAEDGDQLVSDELLGHDQRPVLRPEFGRSARQQVLLVLLGLADV